MSNENLAEILATVPKSAAELKTAMRDRIIVEEVQAIDRETLRMLAARESGRFIDPASLPDRKIEGEPAELELAEEVFFGGRENRFLGR